MSVRIRSSDSPSMRPATTSWLMCSSRYRSASWKFTRDRSGCGAAGPLTPRLRLRLGHESRRGLLAYDGGVDNALGDVVAARELVHGVEQDLFEDRPQATSAGAAQQRE